MRYTTLIITLITFLFAWRTYGQNEPVKTVEVAKRFNIVTIPTDAQLIGFLDNGQEQVQTNPSPEYEPGKGTIFTFEARKPGYVSVRRKYTREKGGVESDTIVLSTRMVKLTASLPAAELVINNTTIVKAPYDLIIPLNKSFTVEARCPGYRHISQTFYNQAGKPDPDPEYNFLLEDRILKLKATPAGAVIFKDGIKSGQDTADILIKKDACVSVYVKLPGFDRKSKSYCNKENEELPVYDEIHLTDRLAEIKTDPDYAQISVDGRDVAAGSYDLKIPEGTCLLVQAKADGYVPASETICNKTGTDPVKEKYLLKLAPDEVLKQTVESNKANAEYLLDVNPDLKPEEAWKKLCSILQEYHFDIETHDDAVDFLRTKWYLSQPMNANSSFPRIIRTRVDVKSGSKKPLRYILQIKNEISSLSKDCVADVIRNQQISNDACFDASSRILRRYAEMIGDIQGRVGFTPLGAETNGSGQDGQKTATFIDNSEPDGKPNNKEGDYFLAIWKCGAIDDTLKITKDGENYQLERKGKKVKLYSREDYLVNKDPSIGKITWSGPHLLFLGKEYEDVTVVAQPK